MLCATGIGVTPYASLLKEMNWKCIIILKLVINEKHKMKIKKVFFFWINRDEGSWEWFVDFLNDLENKNGDFFQIFTFMTGKKNIINYY
jgi:hypothetical protein